MDSLRKTYCPPARGYIAASSPYARAPRIVTTPDTIHAISSQNGELTVRAMSAATMKMPEPIIEPATSMVASVSVSALTNSRDDAVLSAPLVAVVVVKACPGLRLRLGVFLPLCGRNVTPAEGFLPEKRPRKLSRSRQCPASAYRRHGRPVGTSSSAELRRPVCCSHHRELD